ncbi:hypothetical protein [Kitasatospora sp. NPDC002040]|uniref:DUF4190 domain-containing protein n=1 Tax=Kitasatospora sp. NPDC002040 TaxID=3154661 RepID=UPI0033182B89
MTNPAPTESPQPAEAPAETNPWAAPNPGQGEAPSAVPGQAYGAPYWAPHPGPAPQSGDGMGIAALVLGIVGLVLGFLVVLFWLSWLPAVLAVVFGAIGLGRVRKGLAANRAMALAGVLLGVAGLLVSAGGGAFVVTHVYRVKEQQQAEDKAWEQATREREAKARDEQVKEWNRLEADRKRVEAEQAKKAADEKARQLSFGGSYTYPDGLKVTMAKPERYVPSEIVFEAPKDAVIIQVTITVVNTGPAELSLVGAGLPFVRDAKGGLVFPISDGSGREKFLPDSIAPGKEAELRFQYAVPNSAAETITVDYGYGPVSQHKSVIWSGPPR